MSNKPPALLEGQMIKKMYPMGDKHLEVLKGVDIEIQRGEALCIVGSSGAGKSTLLHILGTLDRPSLGKVLYKNQDLTRKNEDELAEFRNQNMGFVFQFHHLLSEFSAIENVMMPCRIAGDSKKEAEKAAREYLDRLGLSQRINHYPSEMSGGEQQRVAIARALVRKPEILFADEPTGNLDTANGNRIQELFFELKDQLGLTLIVVTHDLNFSSRFPRIMSLRDGMWEKSGESVPGPEQTLK